MSGQRVGCCSFMAFVFRGQAGLGKQWPQVLEIELACAPHM